MRTDPIIDELHQIRQEYLSRFDGNTDAIIRDLQQQQNAGTHRVVSFVGRDVSQDTTDAWVEESERRFARYLEHEQSQPVQEFLDALATEIKQ